MRRIMSQKFSISLKQKVDGQVQVTRIRVPKEILAEEPFLKQQIKKQMTENDFIPKKNINSIIKIILNVTKLKSMWTL